MFSFDLVSLAILWSIWLLSLIGVLSVRGAIRTALSGILAVLIFLIAGFFSYLKIEGYGSFVSEDLSPTTRILADSGATAKALIPKPGEPLLEERCTVAALKVADEGIALSKQILKTKELAYDISEPAREKAESKALSIRNATAKVNDRANTLNCPAKWKEFERQTVRATEKLRLAGYALHAYTTLESSEDRKTQFEQSRKQAELSKKELENCKTLFRNLADNPEFTQSNKGQP